MTCDHPIWVFGGIDSPGQDRVPVPCGRCPPCKKRRVDQWTFRLLQEDKQHEFAHFVTLTFDTRFVPISPNGWMTLRRGYEQVPLKKPSKDGSLVKSVSLCDFTRFMKRLRKLLPGVKLKYYYCGEYGSQKHRPHYHAIIFGVPDTEFYHKAWMLNGESLGAVHIGTVTGDSIAYCMKYIDKPGGGSLFPGWIPFYGRDDRVKPFSCMSKGLGLGYVTPEMIAYHKADLSRLYCTKPGGFRVSMPRYYRDRIFSKSEQKAQLPIIQEAISLNDRADYLEFQRLYSDTGLSFEEYRERQKLGRISNFNSKLKDREF